MTERCEWCDADKEIGNKRCPCCCPEGDMEDCADYQKSQYEKIKKDGITHIYPESSTREDFDKQYDIWNSVKMDIIFTEEDFSKAAMRYEKIKKDAIARVIADQNNVDDK